MKKYNDYGVFSDTVSGSFKASGKDAVTVTRNLLVYLPPNPTGKPVFCFWNGLGEDNGPVDVLTKYNTLSFISKDWQPDFIVIAVQNLSWIPSELVDIIFTTLKDRYGFGKMIFTGLSNGGYGLMKTAAQYPNLRLNKDLVAIIPMSTAEGVHPEYRPPIIQSGVAAWLFGDDPGDIHGVFTHQTYNGLVKENPAGNYRYTNMTGKGHGGWDTYYNPKWKDKDGMSIYDFGLKYAGEVQTPTEPPVQPARKLVATINVYDNGDVEKKEV